MWFWKLEDQDSGVEYFKDLEALSIWIAAFDIDKVDSFTVDKVWLND